MTAKKLLYIIQEQKAEIERLKAEEEKYPFKCVVPFNSMICSKSIEDYDRLINDIWVDAIKEFAEMLKDHLRQRPKWNIVRDNYKNVGFSYDDVFFGIDKIVKEMVGEEK